MDYLPPELQSDISKLWMDAGTSGLAADPRRVRSGGTYMPPSALCGSYVVNRRRTVVRDDFLGTISGDELAIQFTYIDWPGLQEHIQREGTRFETVASWQRSVLEHRRQVLKLAKLSPTSIEVLKEARELWLENKDKLVKLFISQLDYIEKHGDWSLEQFRYYAQEHKGKGLGYRKHSWNSILRDENKLNEAYRQFYKVVSDLVQLLRQDKYFDGEHTIHPKWTYPAVRSRPGELVSSNITDGTGHVVVRKHRDRAAGGVYGMSQLFWPIFKADKKKFLAETLLSSVQQITKLKLITPEVEGIDAYCRFLDEDPAELVLFDTSLAERLEAQISDLPTAANLSIQGYEKRFGQKKFSGLALTRTDQYLTEPFLLLAAVRLGLLSKASHYYFGGDNWACLGMEIPDELMEIFSPTQRWLGHDPVLQAIGGFKVTTDASQKAENWTDRMTKFGMTQTASGLVRLTRSLISMNIVPDIMTLSEFLHKVSRTKLDNIEWHEGAPYHNMIDKPDIAKELVDNLPEFEFACVAVEELANKLSIPYKLVNDVKSPMVPSYYKVL